MPTTLEPPKLKIHAQPEFSGILRDDETFASGTGESLEERLNNGFDRLLLQSGLEISASIFLTLSLVCGVTLGGLAFVIQENLLATALMFGLGGAIPLVWALAARARRQQQMMKQLPTMVDELGRAARTGRSLEQCLSLVADDTPSPLGDEIRLCARKLELGIGLRAALEALPERTGLVSLNVLVLALSVHLVSGGDLVSVLERLSRTIRERMLYVGRLRAVTAASRATAILMIVLPPAILGFFMIRDAEYFSKLFAATWGRNITVAAIVLDAIGIAWVMRILKTSKQT
jgi:tight adherence protein B